MEIFLKDILNNWSVKKLKDISNIIMGQSPESSTYNTSRIGLPFFQGKTEFGEIYPKTVKWCNKPIKISYPNDILISVRAPVGDVNINNTNACIGRGLSAIRALNNLLNYKFLFYFLVKDKERFLKFSQGSTFTAINSNDLNNFEILLPPLGEQNKIASILSTVDDLIENTDHLINTYTLLKTGLMQTLLTKGVGHTKFKETEIGEIPEEWEIKKLKETTERIIVGLATSVTKYYRDRGVPIIRNLNIKNGYFDSTSMLYLDEKFANKEPNKSVRYNDILVVHTGVNLGLSCLVPYDFQGAQTFTTLIITTKSKELFPRYLMHYINSEAGKNEINRLRVGAGKNNLNVKDLNNFIIIIPSLSEQNKIASILSLVDNRIDLYKSKKEKLNLLKKGLTQQLLTGKIRVKV